MVVLERPDWLAWLDPTRPKAGLLRPLPPGAADSRAGPSTSAGQSSARSTLSYISRRSGTARLRMVGAALGWREQVSATIGSIDGRCAAPENHMMLNRSDASVRRRSRIMIGSHASLLGRYATPRCQSKLRG